MSDKYEYPKEIISFVKQIERLEKRGLMISDKLVAKEFLKNISYFRLKGFW
jgi:abortive infection bacteriophage resistance protein